MLPSTRPGSAQWKRARCSKYNLLVTWAIISMSWVNSSARATGTFPALDSVLTIKPPQDLPHDVRPPSLGARYPEAEGRHITRMGSLRTITGVRQHSAQVNDHLLIDVLACGRLEELLLVPYLDGDLAVVAHGDRTDGFQQRRHRAPLDGVT